MRNDWRVKLPRRSGCRENSMGVENIPSRLVARWPGTVNVRFFGCGTVRSESASFVTGMHGCPTDHWSAVENARRRPSTLDRRFAPVRGSDGCKSEKPVRDRALSTAGFFPPEDLSGSVRFRITVAPRSTIDRKS